MLTSFTFSNLGEFPARQDLKFHEVKKDGKGKGRLGILVGTNDTGKSSCFEFLRRCMSEEINHSNSRICVSEEPAWALAHFQIDKETLDKYVSQSLMKKAFGDLNTDKLNMWTGVIFTDGFKIKVIQLDDVNDKWHKTISGKTSVTEERLQATNESSSFTKGGQIVKDGKFMAEIQSDGEDLPEEVFEKIYRSLFGVNGLVTFVFDQRGIGAVTSTKCLQLHDFAGQQNYDCTQERANMITEMVKKVETDEEGKRDFEYLLAKLAATKDFTFKVEGGELKVFKVGSPNAPDQPLKVPSGILGSCLIALLLTLAKDYSTLVIDEPSLGMHPDMITRIREEVVEFVHKKNVTIIMTTRAEQFVSHDTLHNVFRFNRNAEKGTLFCRYLPVQRISELKGYRLDEIRGWLFSSWLIIVEGVTDAILIGAIVKKFSSIKGTDPKYLRLANAKIVGAGSSTKIPNLCSIFKSMGVKVCCVYDADAHKERKKLGLWVTENILDYSKRSEKVVNQDQGHKIAGNIRQLLNTTYESSKEKAAEEEGAKVNQPSFMCDALLLGTLQKSLQDGQLMIHYLLEETKRCEHGKREAFCESLEFALQQTKGGKKMKQEAISMDDVRHLVVLESLFRPVWDSSKNEDNPSDCDGKSNQADINLHAESKFYWGCGCIEDFVNVTLRNRFLTDTKLEPWTYRKSHVGTGQDQKGSPGSKSEYLWYCQKNSPGSIDKLSFQEVNELAHLILQDPDVNPYMKDFEKFLLKYVED